MIRTVRWSSQQKYQDLKYPMKLQLGFQANGLNSLVDCFSSRLLAEISIEAFIFKPY